ncbi:MAG: tetratricopeptide repeat protein [Bacteroidia bacterium]|nr:tetratricopeptide repeat protein [Bacteroidia bacterium]
MAKNTLITSLNNLAALYQAISNYPAAEPLFLEAKKLNKEVLGEKHPDYATSLNNLALLYDNMGNYPAAESLYLEAKKLRKEILGEKHPDYAMSLNNLAVLFMEIGNFPAAEPLYIQSMNILKDALGEKHPSYALSLSNLAALYKAMGNSASSEKDKADKYSAAEPLYLEAKNIIKETLGGNHPFYAQSLNNLAGLYQAKGNYPAAEPLYLEAKKLRKEILGEKHPDYATSLNNLALLYYAMGNSASSEKDRAGKYAAAEHLYVEAKNIWKEVLGEKHSLYATSLNNLAVLYKAMGNSASSEKDRADKYSAAASLYLECLEIINSNIAQNFAFLSEKEKEMYFKTQAGKFTSFYSFSLKYKSKNSEITGTVFNNVVKNKGLLLKSSTAMRTAILNSNDTALISNYEKWITLKKEISQLYSTEIAKRSKDPQQLEQQANAIEKNLVRGPFFIAPSL